MGATETALVSIPHSSFGALAVIEHHLFDDNWFLIDRADPRILVGNTLVMSATVGCRPDGKLFGQGVQRVKACNCDAHACFVHVAGSLLKFRDAKGEAAVYQIKGRYFTSPWWVAEWPD